MPHSLHSYPMIGSLLFLICLSACSSGVPTAQLLVAMPQELEIDGETWSRQEWNAKLDLRLRTYFKNNPQLAENPGFQCQPIAYSRRNTQKIFWVLPVGETCQWIQLEIRNGSFQDILEGEGDPFPQVQSHAN